MAHRADRDRGHSAQSRPPPQLYSTPSQHSQMGHTERDSGRGRSTQSRASRRSLNSGSESRSRSPPPRASNNTDKRRAVETLDDEDDINDTPRLKKKSRNPKLAPKNKSLRTTVDRDLEVVHKGRLYGRWIEMWGTVKTVLEEGIARDPEVDDTCYTKDQNRRSKIFERLVDFMPCVEEMLEDHNASKSIASDLEFGRSGARSTDVSSFKSAIGDWFKFAPAYNKLQKSRMGFQHETCGRLLCPSSLDWANTEIKNGLANGTIKALPDDFPRFLYLNEQVSNDDVFQGFLKGDLLVKAYMHLMRAPSIAASGGMEDLGNRKGNAALHDINSTNIRSIVYTAVLVRFVLSSQQTFTIGGTPGKWPYGQLYREIIEVCELMPSPQRRGLLTWWDERIFGDITATGDQEYSVLGTAHVTMASRMKAQLAAAATLSNITNTG